MDKVAKLEAEILDVQFLVTCRQGSLLGKVTGQSEPINSSLPTLACPLRRFPLFC